MPTALLTPMIPLRGAPWRISRRRAFRALVAAVMIAGLRAAQAADAAGVTVLPGTTPLGGEHDFSAEMRASFRRFLQSQLDASVQTRPARWQRDLSSRAAYEKSIESNRDHLRRMIGVVDTRLASAGPELVATVDEPAVFAETPAYTVKAIRWPVFAGVWGEGLLLQPKKAPVARIVALPDADQTPEIIAGLAPGVAPESQFAARLAEAGCEVVVMVLVNRADEWSGTAGILMTNETHREWIHRQAFEMGRHLIGYEVQKVLAAVDWFEQRNTQGPKLPVGVAGYGEGGLIALYGGAVDPRIEGVLVSGYFDSRQGIADEPIYRNVFGLLTEFGDAEIASLIAPRVLVIEHSRVAAIPGPPAVRDNRRNSGAPGRIETPAFERVRAEVDRLRALFVPEERITPAVTLVAGDGGAAVDFGSAAAREAFLRGLGVASAMPKDSGLASAASPEARAPAAPVRESANAAVRQRRQIEQLVEFNQKLMRDSAGVRERYWADAPPKSAESWPAASAPYREALWDQLVGRYPLPTISPNARTRQIGDKPKFVVYEVLLDVTPDLFAWGYLLVPKDLKPGEKRPVVVCQHGLEGLPADVVNDDPTSPAFRIYQGFATRLAERGFVTYAPHNFYRGGNEFRQLQRLAHPMQKTLFGLTTIQHAQLLKWLSALDFVDPARIGFYGLSYGGNTAMRVPALLEQYAVVIASGDFNEWVYKNVTTDHIHSMVFHNVYEVFEFNLGHTFNHAEMAALIAPRPFMVERGHDDGVARDEWVAAEYAKVRRLYAKLGIPERTTIEFFNGPHQIHGVGTYEFLHRHLRWPVPGP